MAADTVTTSEKTEKPSGSQLEAAKPDFKVDDLHAAHKSTVGGDKNNGSTATLAKPDTASLYSGEHAKDGEALGPKKSEAQDTAKKPAEAPDKSQTPTAKGEVPLFETQHTVAAGETIEQIARQKLGQGASKDEITNYVNVTLDANNIQGDQPSAGRKIDLPGRGANGDFFYNNQENKDEQITVHKDGTVDAKNSSDNTSYHEQRLDHAGSYVRDYSGPEKDDNYKEVHIAKDNYTWTETKDKDGTIHDKGSDGTTRTEDKFGNWKAEFGPENQKKDAQYDKLNHLTTTHNKDGSTLTVTDGSPQTMIIDKDGTKTVTNSETGVETVDKTDAQGNAISTTKVPGKDGSYTFDGKGPKPSDNFHETYDPKSGKTVRTEGKGTPEEKTTTHSPDGTIKVEAKDGDNYQRNPDGSEHHWGKKTFDKPPSDYKHDAAMNQSRADLDNSIKDHIPEKEQASFKKDMADFEARAKKDHLPPDEITKTYGQMNRLLNAKDSDSVVPAKDRALLAEQLMHQTAHPDETSQGYHETCNVTTVAKETLTKNPSKMAEVATSTALNGEFTAPDGKVIKVDKDSLTPGSEESNVKTKDGERSYATQVLNVALVNDSLQRRDPPETYTQQNPDRTIPGDTGERRKDSSGKIIEGKSQTSDGQWVDKPVSDPGLTNHEIATLGKAFNGDRSHVIAIGDPESGIESVNSAKELGQKLQQFKNQGQMPVAIGVDSNHAPFRTPDDERPGFGGHIVNITDYDAKNGKVLISNQWDSKHNGWVKLNDLYGNGSGDFAGGNDGVNNDWPDQIKPER